jgi:hypothetical protein
VKVSTWAKGARDCKFRKSDTDLELLLREFKGSFAMAKIPTRSFWANATYMEMLL